MKIQILEDDRALSDGIRLALCNTKMPDGEAVSFIQNITVRSAQNDCMEQKPDLLILDINLPDGSGYDYIKWLRERSDMPVLMLTANDMEMDEVMGLTLGADDYMTKPFRIAVLRARVETLLRRTKKHIEKTNVYKEDKFIFDFSELKFTRDGQELALSVNEQRLLRLLVEHKGQLLTRTLLYDRIWGVQSEFVDENALSVTVNRLRAKLSDGCTHATYIQTVYGQGYRWQRQEG